MNVVASVLPKKGLPQVAIVASTQGLFSAPVVSQHKGAARWHLLGFKANGMLLSICHTQEQMHSACIHVVPWHSGKAPHWQINVNLHTADGGGVETQEATMISPANEPTRCANPDTGLLLLCY